MTKHDLTRRLAAEFIGTTFLLATVIGSGIMGEALSGGNIALALLGNTVATGAILIVLILVFGPISGAHFNPAVTLTFLLRREITPFHSILYVAVQIIAGLFGALVAHVMFGEPAFSASMNARTGFGQWTGEFVATFGLIAAILGCIRFRPEAVPYAVGLFITAGYWFTSSTSFANPAVTIARSVTDSFSGIRPDDAPVFIIVQLGAAILATAVFGWFAGGEKENTG
ncbi:MAG: aquaporin family protein [Alphaproteobacteria bacterium]|nr:aquaporin family protein [Alphaproteobacteria bacterium]HCP00894.1 aquaporin family protein [Rhodospirillaceae bacterium]